MKLIKSVIVLLVIVNAAQSSAMPASREIPYYGDEFFSSLRSGASDEDLQYELKKVLRSFHVPSSNGLDEITTSCEGRRGCYSHRAVGYGSARVFLMGKYYLVSTQRGYAVHDVYCDTDRDQSEFGGDGPGPDRIPNHAVVNIEHTWPQSRFNGRFPSEYQKSDLHHLFPTDSQLNAIRGNNLFGEVIKDQKILKCRASRFGIGSAGNREVFEPPRDHHGNVARALFYFATRYDLKMDEREEVVMRKWHREDPVDEDEIRRNEEIYKMQGNRNPFIDYPELVDNIQDF